MLISKSNSKGKGKADDKDRSVGIKLRDRRIQLGISQQKLASQVGVTFQQVQKYERGINRIGASRLEQLANALEAPITYFFGNDENNAAFSAGFAEKGQEKFLAGKINTKETTDLLRAYYAIEDERIRKQIIAFAKSLVQK